MHNCLSHQPSKSVGGVYAVGNGKKSNERKWEEGKTHKHGALNTFTFSHDLMIGLTTDN